MVIDGDRLVKFTPQENKRKGKAGQLSGMDTEPKRMGRPKKEIDKTEFRKLCELQCTLGEIAGFFDCSEDTIQNWCKREFDENFSAVYKRMSEGGKVSLRRHMMKLSEKSAIMAIFLAKNWLGMTDNVEVKADTSLMQTLVDVVQGKQEIADTEPISDEDLKNYIL